MRSWLFVPGDSEKKAEKAAGSGADILIFDLEDSVAAERKDEARMLVAARVQSAGPREWSCVVRINPFDSGRAAGDLEAVVKPGLDAVLLPKAEGGADVARLADQLDRCEAAAGVAPGSVKIAVIATETPAAVFALSTYKPAHSRLVALTWGAEDLAAAIGASANREQNGRWTEPYAHVRTLALLGAGSAGVAAIDTLHADFRDLAGLEEDCRRSRRDGFVGRLAIHPAQVETINRCYTPSAAEIEWAQRIVDAFAANPGAGALGLDGKMIDLPHLIAARKTLAAAG